MTLALELGSIRDPAVQRALQVIAQQFPVAATGGGGGGAPSGPAGGVLGGTYPNPGFAVDMATQAELDTHTALTTTAHGGIVASTDPRLTDSRAPSGPAGGDLSGTYPNPGIAPLVIVDGDISATAAIAESKLSLATDAAAGVGSRRTLGTGALQATAGNDARLSDARTPTAHHTSHEPGGGDPMAVDAAAGVGSLRTIGTGALQAAAGNDARLTNTRTPTAHATTHQSGGTDALTGNLDAVGRSNIKKAGTTIGTRRGLNLIEGTNVTITVADDAGNEEVDVTIAAAAGASASALAGAYEEITWSGGTLGASLAAGKYILWGGSAVLGTSAAGVAAGTLTSAAALYIDPADWTVAGLTTKLRVTGFCHVGATAPARSIQVGLYAVTTFLNTTVSVIGALTGTGVTFTTPAANSHTRTAGADFNVPAAGWYVLVAEVLAGATAASSSTQVGALLQKRWV